MTTQPIAPTCAIKPTTPKTEGPVKRFVRRLKQTIAPTRCQVRWDTNASAWAVLEEGKTTAKRHFAFGFMTNVTLKVQRAPVATGCGGSSDSFAGIAEGDLVENSFGFGQDHAGFQNLDFKGEAGFVDGAGHPLASVSTLRLLEGRKAVWK